MIATLLVPLNFLAIAAFTQGAAANDALTLAGEGLSAIVFAVLVYVAGRIVAPGAAVPLAVGVMVPSLVQLLDPPLGRAGGTAHDALRIGGRAGGVLCGDDVARDARGARAEPTLEEAGANRLFTFLGVVSAATFFPLALLAWRVPPAMDDDPLAVAAGGVVRGAGAGVWLVVLAADDGTRAERRADGGARGGRVGGRNHGGGGGCGVARSGDAAARWRR